VGAYSCGELVAHEESVLDLDWSEQELDCGLRLFEVGVVLLAVSHWQWYNSYIFKSASSAGCPLQFDSLPLFCSDFPSSFAMA
jgi:hypothetical protein